MIAVAMAGEAEPSETPRVWFDRAVAAQFDYYEAYSSLLWSLRPRWLGSHEEMYDFGLECLATTNVIESLLSGVVRRSGRVTRWRDGEMALRWAGAAALETEKRFRSIVGHRDLWMLKAALEQGQAAGQQPAGRAADEAPIPLHKDLVAA